MKKSETGFSVVAIVLTVLAMSLVLGAGLYVWSRNPPETAKHESTSQNSNNQANTSLNEITSIKTEKITNNKFTVSIPSNWNLRTCMDHDGVAALVPGGDGEIRCVWSDAQWLDTDMASRGKVAIGYASSPYPRQDFNDGQQQDIYKPDAEVLNLSNGRTAKKYKYTSEEVNNKGKTFKVVEYIVEDNVTVFVFEGHTSENSYVNKLPTSEVIKIIEEIVLPSIQIL